MNKHPQPLPTELRIIETITFLTENSIRLPFTKYKFGIDPLLGLFPAVGDAIALLISALTLVAALRTGVKRKVVFIMLGNILFDFIFGSIPIIGNVFDFAYKANTRNVHILQKYYATGQHPVIAKKKIVGILLAIFFIIFLCIVLTVWAVWWLCKKLGWI